MGAWVGVQLGRSDGGWLSGCVARRVNREVLGVLELGWWAGAPGDFPLNLTNERLATWHRTSFLISETQLVLQKKTQNLRSC